MHLGKWFVFGIVAAVLPAVAEEAADRKTATSLKYVEHELDTRQNKFGAEQNKAMEYTNTAGDVQKRAVTSDLDNGGTDSLPMVGGVNTKLDTKQDDIDPVNDHTAVTYTGQPGGIGRKGIYQATGTYAEQRNDLIDAKTFNAALKNGLDSEFVCRDDNLDPVSGLCWLYTIHNTVGNGLPDGYTELEYLIFDGQSYFDTGIVLRDIHNIENVIEMQNANPDNNAFQTWTGFMYPNGMSMPRYGINIYNGRWMIGVNETWSSSASPDRNKHTLRFVTTDDRQTLYDTDGSVLVSRTLGGNFSSNALPLYIGARNQESSVTNYVIGNIGRTWLSQNGTKLYDYIPARNSAGVLGMYDMVSRTFKQNAGQGTLTPGPALNVYIPQNQ